MIEPRPVAASPIPSHRPFVEVEALARALGVLVLTHYPGVGGCWRTMPRQVAGLFVPGPGQPEIAVNGEHDPSLRAITIAHALLHHCGPRPARDERFNLPRWEAAERDVDQRLCELFMPVGRFLRAFTADPDLGRLAQAFGVPIAACEQRARRLFGPPPLPEAPWPSLRVCREHNHSGVQIIFLSALSRVGAQLPALVDKVRIVAKS